MRVVFFGTPEFAVASLRALLRERISVVGVVTQPDKPQGRSRTTLVAPPVKVVAQAEALPILQPTRPVGDLFLAALRRLEPELGVVVAYGHVLRREVLELPPRGLINVHASLLPRFRGAAPIQHAILSGDRETGICIMRMEEGLDTGPVLHRVATPIGDDETAGTLSRRLATLGANALVEAVSLLSAGLERPQPQDDAAATYAPKISREGARLDWSRDASDAGAPGARVRPDPRRVDHAGRGAGQALRGHARGRQRRAGQRARGHRPAGHRLRKRRARRARSPARRQDPPRGRGLGPGPGHLGRAAVRMRPLPRLHAITDARVLALDDLGVRAAAIAAAGSAVALHARDRSAGGARLASVARRFLTLAKPPEAALFVNGRPDIAGAVGAQGVQLGLHDLTPAEARASFPLGWIGRSVHSVDEAGQALEEGADYLLVGTVFPSSTHPGHPGAGPGLVRTPPGSVCQ